DRSPKTALESLAPCGGGHGDKQDEEPRDSTGCDAHGVPRWPHRGDRLCMNLSTTAEMSAALAGVVRYEKRNGRTPAHVKQAQSRPISRGARTLFNLSYFPGCATSVVQPVDHGWSIARRGVHDSGG